MKHLLYAFPIFFVSTTTTQTIVPLNHSRLSIVGSTPPNGLFDPSLIPTGNVEFPYALSYSSVFSTANISTQIAVYDEAISSFVFVANVNAALSSTFPCVNGVPCEATQIHEVSSLVADPSEPDPRCAIKVFSHSYLVFPNNELHYELGFISLYCASNVTGPFSHTPLLGWASSSPISTAGVKQVLTDIPQLNECLLFSEPGALFTPWGGLLLSLTCITPTAPGATAPGIRVVLLRQEKNGGQWVYAGLALDSSDAANLPGGPYAVPQISAPNLFIAPPGGKDVFLLVSPSSRIWVDFVGYNGCLVVALNSNNTGVVRDAHGVPIVLRRLIPDGPAFNGACTAAPSPFSSSVGGYFLSVLQLPGQPFSVIPTGVDSWP